MLGGLNTVDDPGATHFVFQGDESSVEFLGALKSVHALNCIRLDTITQGREASVAGEASLWSGGLGAKNAPATIARACGPRPRLPPEAQP